MERVAVDVIGSFPETENGNKYILIAIDYFSKWPEAYALPNQEAVTLAKIIVSQFFSRFGVPAELHSDQGRNFDTISGSLCATWPPQDLHDPIESPIRRHSGALQPDNRE